MLTINLGGSASLEIENGGTHQDFTINVSSCSDSRVPQPVHQTARPIVYEATCNNHCLEDFVWSSPIGSVDVNGREYKIYEGAAFVDGFGQKEMILLADEKSSKADFWMIFKGTGVNYDVRVLGNYLRNAQAALAASNTEKGITVTPVDTRADIATVIDNEPDQYHARHVIGRPANTHFTIGRKRAYDIGCTVKDVTPREDAVQKQTPIHNLFSRVPERVPEYDAPVRRPPVRESYDPTPEPPTLDPSDSSLEDRVADAGERGHRPSADDVRDLARQIRKNRWSVRKTIALLILSIGVKLYSIIDDGWLHRLGAIAGIDYSAHVVQQYRDVKRYFQGSDADYLVLLDNDRISLWKNSWPVPDQVKIYDCVPQGPGTRAYDGRYLSVQDAEDLDSRIDGIVDVVE